MKRLLIPALCVLLALALVPAAMAAEAGDKVSALIVELMKIENTPDSECVTLWLPTEYWKAAISDAKSVTPQAQQRTLKFLDGYVIILAVKMNKGSGGSMTFAPFEEVMKGAKLINPSGESYAPLETDKLLPEAKTFFQNMGPALAKMLGPMGKGMHLLAFPATDKAGKRLADPTLPGKLSFTMNGHTFAWHLPLGGLLPPQKCEKCGETFKGDFLFCPYDGTALKTGPGTEPK